MDVTPWTIYWITRLDSVNVVLGLFVGLALILTVLSVGFLLSSIDADDENGIRWAKRGIFGFSALLLGLGAVTVLTPSTKQMAAILVIPAIVNNEGVQEVGGELVDLAREWMRELRPEGGQ